ncbi:acylphosphatase [Geothrix edaphica]|uniref:acylphosphatase n=1 Tax=Geothrix edaphica TaxID=2927976 RepID=UPI0025571E6F|nr:acylphosphatase [Geothrix edaphica]
MRFHVHGAVQGVGYRRFVEREARALELAGWVRNEPDGSVSGEVEGPAAALAALRPRLAEGPSFAAVRRLDWEPLDVRSSLPFPFQILR